MKVKSQDCPTCGKELNAATVVYGANTVRPGDFAVCAYCGQILVFDESLTQVVATQKDLREVDRKTLLAILKSRSAVLAIRAARN